MSVSALALFSGGLDSILACRVIAQQGVRVIAIKFVTPFFDYALLTRQSEYRIEIKEKYDLDVEVVDLGNEYLNMLCEPAHGFGKHFNPCLDCKILMLQRARALMPRYNASFLVTGEVLGQRPMSQRRDAMRVVERDSDCKGILLRPLSARLLPVTIPEQEGLVDRSKLHAISGRGRKEQIELAKGFKLSEYPNAAGGCILADPNLAKRIESYYSGKITGNTLAPSRADIRLLLLGRQYLLFDRYWFILGRDEGENEQILAAREPDDWLLHITTRPGPIGLVRNVSRIIDKKEQGAIFAAAAGLLVRYGKKVGGMLLPAEVVIDFGDKSFADLFEPLPDALFSPWRVQ